MNMAMTLGNMRASAVRTLDATCSAMRCNHSAVIDVRGHAEEVPVPAFGSRMVCTARGAIGADARPNRNERAPRPLFRS
jgi:hypothetical protein